MPKNAYANTHCYEVYPEIRTRRLALIIQTRDFEHEQKRRQYGADFQAKVALDALKGDETSAEIAVSSVKSSS